VIHALGHDETALASWLETEGKSKDELDTELRAASEESVRTQLLLDAMAEASGVGVNQEEFTERILFNAQRFGISPDEYFKRIQEQNQLTAIFSEVRRAKALADAVSKATVTDESGNVLDVAALFGFEPVTADESVGAEAPELDDSDIDTDEDTDSDIGVVDATSEDVTGTEDSAESAETSDSEKS
jgi:trigger factor